MDVSRASKHRSMDESCIAFGLKGGHFGSKGDLCAQCVLFVLFGHMLHRVLLDQDVVSSFGILKTLAYQDISKVKTWIYRGLSLMPIKLLVNKS